MSAAKALKSIALTATAQEHHIAMKTKSVLKWLKAGHEVRIQIQGKADRAKAMEDIFKQIERQVKSGAEVKQKVVKPEVIKFNLRPTPLAANLTIEDDGATVSVDLDQLTSGKDVFSKEFEDELLKSIEDDQSRLRKR